jgi:hypothetical protein
VRTYLGRITKARILEAVREGVSHEAADRMADMKKPDMAEAAEQLLAATDWLPALMRNRKPCKSVPSNRRRMLPRKRMQTPTPPSDRHSRDRQYGPGPLSATVEISAARHQARGYRHDPHSPTASTFKGKIAVRAALRARPYAGPEEDMTV